MRTRLIAGSCFAVLWCGVWVLLPLQGEMSWLGWVFLGPGLMVLVALFGFYRTADHLSTRVLKLPPAPPSATVSRIVALPMPILGSRTRVTGARRDGTLITETTIYQKGAGVLKQYDFVIEGTGRCSFCSHDFDYRYINMNADWPRGTDRPREDELEGFTFIWPTAVDGIPCPECARYQLWMLPDAVNRETERFKEAVSRVMAPVLGVVGFVTVLVINLREGLPRSGFCFSLLLTLVGATLAEFLAAVAGGVLGLVPGGIIHSIATVVIEDKIARGEYFARGARPALNSDREEPQFEDSDLGG